MVKTKDAVNDMTVGTPAKLIIQFMIPVFLGNIFQQFYNIADSIVAGQFIGVKALAAIGSTGSLMFFVTGWLNGLSSGFAILVSQWFGAKQYDKMRHYVAMSVYLAGGCAVLMTAGLLIANEPILRMMNYSAEIMPEVKQYMGIIYAGLIVTAAYNSLAAFLRAIGDSKSPLYFLIISAVINVALDVVFIVVFGMGVEGCAYATVIAQAISALLCFIYIVKKVSYFAFDKIRSKDFFSKFRASSFTWHSDGASVFNYGDRNDYRSGERLMYMVKRTWQVFRLQETAKYDYDGVRCIWSYSRYLCRTEPRSRENGPGKVGVRCTQVMILVWSVIAMAAVCFGGKYMTWLFIDPSETEVVNVSVLYFRTVFWCYPFLGSIFLYRNTLQGMGYGLVPMLGGVFELAARSAIVMAAAGRTTFQGVCLADPAAWIAALIPLVPYYFYTMRKWKTTETKIQKQI